jgi:uncharacterized protein YndB with AHSA1/START domain
MAINERVMPLPADAIWTTLADGRSYGTWVVGTRTIRAVDQGFPGLGKRLHYRIGYGPIKHDGHTEVLSVDSGRRLELEANAWPIGTVRIVITLDAEANGHTRVTIDEKPARGIAAAVHNPVQDLVIKIRNVETLRRLERLARSQQGLPQSLQGQPAA